MGLAQFVGGSVFTVGLMLVVIGGAELFTGNNLIVIPCLSKGKKRADLETTSIAGLARNWGVVYVGNFVGALLLAFLVFGSGLYTMGGNQLGAKALAIANAKVQLPFAQALFRGILCNWLVCLAIWLSASADDTIGKILAIYFPIMAFVAMGFEHSVANMFLIPMGILLKGVTPVVAKVSADLSNLTWEGFLINNLVPVTIGNIIGGAFFVGTLYWYIYIKDMQASRPTEEPPAKPLLMGRQLAKPLQRGGDGPASSKTGMVTNREP